MTVLNGVNFPPNGVKLTGVKRAENSQLSDK